MDHLQNVMGYFDQQQPLCAEHDRISKDLYKEFGVKAGLRDENGKGVLAGLTNISDIRAFQYVDGVKKPADGQLLYRGYDVKDLIRGSSGSRFAFEEAGYLLLFGELPYTFTMLGWFSSEMALDSFLKRRTRSGSCIYSCRSTFTATTVPAGTGPLCPSMTAL